MDKSFDFEPTGFSAPSFGPPSVTNSPTPQTKVFKTLEEAFAAFDNDTDESSTPYLVQNTELPPIPPSEDVQAQLIQNALLLVDAGEYSLCRIILGEVLKKNSKSVEAIRWMGWCFKQEKSLENAQKCYEQLIQLRLLDQDLFELGEIYYEQKNDAEAIHTWLRALSCCSAESPHLFDLHKSLGNAFTRSGDFDSAEENYNKALTLRGASDVLQVNIGTLEFQRQNYLGAMASFKQALDINAFNDRAWTGIALVAREMKDLEWAKATLYRALDINPHNLPALQILTHWAQIDSIWDDAIERIQIYVDKFQDSGDMIFALAALNFQKGDVRIADLELTRLEALDPERDVSDLRKLVDTKLASYGN